MWSGVGHLPSGRRCLEFTPRQYQLMDARYRAGATLEELARDHDVTGPTIRAHLQKLGTPIRCRHARGDRHGWWRGGRTIDSHGYVRRWVDRDDPFYVMANASGYVLEHRLVAAQNLGRPLRRDEQVHHLNGDRADNRLENLQLRQGPHGKGVALCCADCGSTNLTPKDI
jgi:hypothetical protein